MVFKNTIIMLSNLKHDSIIQPCIMAYISEIEFEGQNRLDEGQREIDLYILLKIDFNSKC